MESQIFPTTPIVSSLVYNFVVVNILGFISFPRIPKLF